MIATWRHPGLPMAFWRNVQLDPSGCWLWTGSKSNDYGQCSVHGRSGRAYGFTWRMVNGEVPDGLELDHLCRVRACVNPDHLEAVTKSENLLRAYAARRAEGLPVARGCAIPKWLRAA